MTYNKDRMTEMIRKFWNHAWGLSIFAGIFLGLSFPPFDLVLLQFPAFLFLFRLAELCGNWRELMIRSYLSFIIWNLMSTYWLMMATLSGGIAAILANSLLMVIPLLLIRALLAARQSGIGTLTLAAGIGCTWVSYEFLHHHWDLSWTWLALGNGWSNMTGVIQYISITGFLAISFWVVMTSALLYLTLTADQQMERKRNLIYTFFLSLLFPLLSIISHALYNGSERVTTANPLEVAVVQPDMNSYLDFGGMKNVDELLTLLFELSDSVRTPDTKVIVWPENAIDMAISRDSPLTRRIRDSVSTWNIDLITGAGYVEYYKPDEEPAIVRGQNTGRSYNIFNSAFHFTGSQPPDIYKKGRLVPVVERLPFAEFLKKMDLFGWINWGTITGYGRGTSANNFRIDGHATPALVCYDSVFPDWIGKFVRNGATFLTIVTNDGWWGHTSGHIQHFAYARLRAIEYRRWIVRSANNGISGIIAPDGSIRVKTGFRTRTVFTFPITPSDYLTPFARYGNWFNWLMLIGLGFILIDVKVRTKK
ncbi:MAG: apolipoprotein N-acyltransferase [Balneolaceae bacterium]